jgi:exopolysaccharide biosynthesis protein
VFSNIPFIKKWRTIYIETAMTTATHQWLATAFIPGYIIDDVMSDAKDQQVIQDGLQSSWEDIEKPETTIPNIDDATEVKPINPTPEETTPAEPEEVKPSEEELFFEKYWEVEKEKLNNYMKANNIESYENLLIENLDGKIDVSTTFGEKIKVLDNKNNLLIIEVTGEGYSGLLAIVKDPSQVTVAKSTTLGSYGNLISKFSKDNNALVAINASGFADENWQGNGGTITGSMVIDGVDYGNPQAHLKFFGFKADNKLHIENYDVEKIVDYKWGIQFSPALIVDGKKYVQSTFGYGIQPRSAVAQTISGEFLMLIIDGRKVGHSLGATVDDLAEIMLRHNAYQAMNLDGGSSSIMNYRGKTISKPSSKNSLGRYLPNAFICRFADQVKED